MYSTPIPGTEKKPRIPAACDKGKEEVEEEKKCPSADSMMYYGRPLNPSPPRRTVDDAPPPPSVRQIQSGDTDDNPYATPIPGSIVVRKEKRSLIVSDSRALSLAALKPAALRENLTKGSSDEAAKKPKRVGKEPGAYEIDTRPDMIKVTPETHPELVLSIEQDYARVRAAVEAGRLVLGASSSASEVLKSIPSGGTAGGTGEEGGGGGGVDAAESALDAFGIEARNPFDFRYVMQRIMCAPSDSLPFSEMQRRNTLRATLPPITRTYEEAYMREHVGDEPPCMNGRLCEGWEIMRILYNTTGFTLRAFYFPHEETEALRTKAWPTKERKCILCMRYSIHKALINIRSHRQAVPHNTLIQNYRNLTNIPGEYRSEDTDMSRSQYFEGMTDPVVMHRRTVYRPASNDGVRCFEQMLPHPSVTGEQDF